MCASDSHSTSLLILKRRDAIRRELLENSNFFCNNKNMRRVVYEISFKILFGKKRCPKCGKKMKVFILKNAVSEEERLIWQHQAERSGKPVALNGSMSGYRCQMCLKCCSCGLVLNDSNYKSVRKKQKESKRIILTEEELKTTIKQQNDKAQISRSKR